MIYDEFILIFYTRADMSYSLIRMIIRISEAWIQLKDEAWGYSLTHSGLEGKKKNHIELQQNCCINHGWIKSLRNYEMRSIKKGGVATDMRRGLWLVGGFSHHKKG